MPKRRLNASIRELEDQFLRCRTLGHVWDEIPGDVAQHGRRMNIGQRMDFRCVRCGMGRHEVWSRSSGQLVSRGYDYPAEWVKIIGVVGRAAYRLELLDREDNGLKPLPIRMGR